ncbi:MULTISPECIES: TetR/AcrR family transcriptional regulator [unclassified Streptomyces]|uniref:TetR/AcrR family transcriptional regulator n=1 Tax=unclassified Streptomyces TaxID=2593676 RepID=UPI002DDC53CB|nr:MULTISPECIES: TetR/AcrR family transcriptional regulator [unclassified Streptomyces]WSA91720.1 TetR/AcrR family transcriptional regulator [Streptomyces sp. NBC_01795]WSB76092.1 TetR/AcrR family transcriptional regulator [Streptomyces sp. NBC_01775]WSS44476.1 TetR/AcrR family transcriptional regulator [Streptomyces sp. NBC_01187]
MSEASTSEEDPGLRARLVAAGAELVASQGVRGVSLRAIARHAGVSHGAPRRYFPTHVALLSAVAREGFADLGARARRELAATESEGPRAQLAALGRVYLGFAHERRGMYELMFRHDLLESGELGLRETTLPLFGTLVDLVDRAGGGGRDAGADPRVTAGALWANLHGIAQLWEWGSLQLATGAGQSEALLDAALAAHLGPEPR